MTLLARGAWFVLGFVAVFLAAAAVSVYVLGQVERIKGPTTTFMIFAWLSPVYACLGAACYMLGLRSEPHKPGWLATVMAGGVVALLFSLALSVPDRNLTILVVLPWVVVIAGGFAAPRVLRTFAGRRLYRSSQELLLELEALIGRLQAAGHESAAAELRSGAGSLNGLTDGWALLLDSIEKVRGDRSKVLGSADQAALSKIRAGVRHAVYGPR